MYDCDIISVLPDFGDLFLEVQISELSHITGFENVDGFGHC